MRVLTAALLLLAACSSSGDDVAADATVAPDAAALDAPARDMGICALVRPYSSRNLPCNSCAEQRCCTQVNGCLLDPDCDDGYVNCAIACALDPGSDAGPSVCLAECARQYPRGKVEYDDATGCVDQMCPTECQ
jgi:hypothetical protein